MSQDSEKLFGNDIQLTEGASGFDLARNFSGDLDIARGNGDIIQALILRLKVRKGELAPLGWPDYGSRLHELIGEPNNPRTHVILMAHSRNAIEQDDRVAKVTGVRTQVLPGEPNVVRIIMDILLINEPNPINLVFEMNLEGT